MNKGLGPRSYNKLPLERCIVWFPREPELRSFKKAENQPAELHSLFFYKNRAEAMLGANARGVTERTSYSLIGWPTADLAKLFTSRGS